jgi:hypothetical protein
VSEPRYTQDRWEYQLAGAVGLTLAGGPGLVLLYWIIESLGGQHRWSNWHRFWFVVCCLAISALGQAVEKTVKRVKELEHEVGLLWAEVLRYRSQHRQAGQ